VNTWNKWAFQDKRPFACKQNPKRGERGLALPRLYPHDWATDAARNGTNPFRWQEAGGWSSLAMPRRYVEAAAIANLGMKLSTP